MLFPIMEGYSFTDYDSNFAEIVAQTDQVVGNSNSSTWDFAQDKDGFWLSVYRSTSLQEDFIYVIPLRRVPLAFECLGEK